VPYRRAPEIFLQGTGMSFLEQLKRDIVFLRGI
jgi:hypothetical protein